MKSGKRFDKARASGEGALVWNSASVLSTVYEVVTRAVVWTFAVGRMWGCASSHNYLREHKKCLISQ